jgi:CBS domain-containing protein
MEVRAVIAADIMVRKVVTIAPDESVARAASLMTANDVSALPVINTDGVKQIAFAKPSPCQAAPL